VEIISRIEPAEKQAHSPHELVRAALNFISSGSAGDASQESGIFDDDFRAHGPGSALFAGVGNRTISRVGPFSGVEIDVHRISRTPTGAAALITYRGRQTGTFNGVVARGRWFVGDGVVVFEIDDGRVTGATTLLQWSPVSPPATVRAA
jgi:hypothetical protein